MGRTLNDAVAFHRAVVDWANAHSVEWFADVSEPVYVVVDYGGDSWEFDRHDWAVAWLLETIEGAMYYRWRASEGNA